MTDTSSVDQGDDADTKTTPDQPGQPNTQQTWRPPAGLPTPLAALASQVKQATQGSPVGPLPQPAPVPPLDRAQQRAQEREAPYARETGAFPPYRESPVQTYVPARPIRDPNQWGTPDPYPNTPATWELPGMWRGIGQTLSQIGSGNVGAIAGLLAPFSADSMKSYVAGQSARIKLDHERAVDAAWETDRRLDVELRDARDGFAALGGDVTSWDGLKDVDKFMDYNRALVAKNNDYNLQVAIDSGDVKRVENLWKERDAASRDLKASLAQQEKDAEKRRIEQPFRIDGGPSQAGPPMGDHPNPPAIDDSVPSDSTPDPSTTPEGTGTPPASTPDDVTSPQQDISPYPDGVPDAQAQARRVQPSGVQVAQAGASDAPQPGMERLAQAARAQPAWRPAPSRILEDARAAGWKPDIVDALGRKAFNNPLWVPNAKGAYPDTPLDMSGYVGIRAQEIGAELDRIKRSSLRGKDAEDAIRAVDPALADQIKQYVLGNLPVPQSQKFNNLAASYILPLGNKIDPGFNENTFRLRYATKKDFTSGIEGRTLTSIATAKGHLEHALAAMDHVPNYLQSQFGNWRSLDWVPGLGNKSVQDAIGTLDNAIHTGSNEYERALLGGKPPRGAVTDTENELDWRHKNPEYVKALLRDKISALKVRLDKLKGDFRAGFGRGPDDMYRLFDGFATSGRDKPDNEQDDRTLAGPGQAQQLRDLDRPENARPNAPPPAPPGWKFEPVQ